MKDVLDSAKIIIMTTLTILKLCLLLQNPKMLIAWWSIGAPSCENYN
jgi:hypothetical protein